MDRGAADAVQAAADAAGAGPSWPPRQPHDGPAGKERGFEVVAYEPAHLRRLVVEGRQAHLAALVEDEAYAVNIARGGPNWTALGDGRPIAVAGFYVPWEGRAIAHAILASDCGRWLPAIVRAVRKAIAGSGFERIEAHVLTDRRDGHRFARLCGFQRRFTMERFQAGRSYDYYDWVRPWS